jgi:hypothetical protein
MHLTRELHVVRGFHFLKLLDSFIDIIGSSMPSTAAMVHMNLLFLALETSLWAFGGRQSSGTIGFL